MTNIFDTARNWFTAKDERTWLSHALVTGAAITAGHFYGGEGAAIAMVAFYAIRESKDAFRQGKVTTDNVGDFVAPALVALGYFLLFV